MINSINKDNRWEFGSQKWCQFAAETGVRLIKEANLDLSKYEWGFSEEYSHIPERLLGERDKAGWHFMIHDGKVSGGAGLPAECLSLPGFHVSVPWASIAHASSFIYDLSGQRKRQVDEAAMWAEITATAGVDPEKESKKAAEKPASRCMACGSPDHDRPDCPVWPPGIGEALSAGAGDGGGLHNITAKRLKLSPEVKDLPQTKWGVPLISKMTNEEKTRFLKLLGR